MTRGAVVRRAALAAMVLVSSFSLWAWAEGNAPSHGPKGMHPHAPLGAASAHAAAPGAQGEAAEHAGEGAEAAEEAGPAPMNWTDFDPAAATRPFVAVLINFALLGLIYYLLGRKPLTAALAERRETIAKDIEEAQRLKAAADERAKVYQAKLEKLEEEVRAAREALVRAGEAERERIVNEAAAKAERLRTDAKFLVEQELKQVRQDLWREAVEAAVLAAETILSEKVTAADQERLAEEYLQSLGGHKAAATPAPRPAQEPAT